MKILKKILLLLILSLSTISAYSDPSNTNDSKNQADSNANREKGVDTINQQGVTADTQRKADNTDIEMTRKLRARIMADDQLSTEAHNIKIISLPHGITLKGPVASRAEKVKLENYARSMAGNKKVYNQLTY